MTSLIRYDSQIKLVSSQLKEREQEAERAALESDRLRVELNEERLAHAAVRERFEQVRQPTASNCLSLPLIASHCLSLPLIASHCLSLPLIAIRAAARASGADRAEEHGTLRSPSWALDGLLIAS